MLRRYVEEDVVIDAVRELRGRAVDPVAAVEVLGLDLLAIDVPVSVDREAVKSNPRDVRATLLFVYLPSDASRDPVVVVGTQRPWCRMADAGIEERNLLAVLV